MPKKLTKYGFIEKAKLKHGDSYDYSLVNYINNSVKIKIICSIHGEFEQQPNNHLLGRKYSLIEQKRKDMIKTKYCEDNNIKLLRINYKDDITSKLNKFLKTNELHNK